MHYYFVRPPPLCVWLNSFSSLETAGLDLPIKFGSFILSQSSSPSVYTFKKRKQRSAAHTQWAGSLQHEVVLVVAGLFCCGASLQGSRKTTTVDRRPQILCRGGGCSLYLSGPRPPTEVVVWVLSVSDWTGGHTLSARVAGANCLHLIRSDSV